MKPNLFKITELGQGALYIMPKPSKEWLEDDLTYLKSQGITSVISLLEDQEEYELGLRSEKAQLQQLAMQFQRFAIPDRSVPSLKLTPIIISVIKTMLNQGQHVAVHCRAGIGRSGLMASCVLIEYGWNAADAMSWVSDARGILIPDTEEQIMFIEDYAAHKIFNGGA